MKKNQYFSRQYILKNVTENFRQHFLQSVLVEQFFTIQEPIVCISIF